MKPARYSLAFVCATGLVIAASAVALSTGAHAEKITLACEPDGNASAPFIVDVDYDRRTVIMTGIAMPARITDREIKWEHKFEAGANNYDLNRITGRLTFAYSVVGNVGTFLYRCSRAEKKF